MRKSVRMFLLSLFAAATTLPAMADGQDVSNKLWNLDCQTGMSGWNITFTTPDNNGTGYVWKTSNHTEATGDFGYYNFDAQCIEMWGRSTEEPMGEATISQFATGLENGTYVFGAWMVSTIQMNDSVREARGWGDDIAAEVQGVTVFANENSTPAQTNDPSTSKDTGHAWKFNVAAKVTDGKLTVGVKNSSESNANFICIDNASLYFFGDVTEDEALAQMAAIDFANDKAAADTLKAYPMAKDSLDAMTGAEDHLSLRLAMKKAQISIRDYKNLSNAIERAEGVLAQEWSEYVAEYVENLTAATAEAKEVLATGPYDRDALNEYLDEYKNKIDLVEIDELYDVKDAFYQFIYAPDEISADNPNLLCGDFHPGFETETGEVGKYPMSQYNALEALFLEVEEGMTAIDNGEKPAADGVAYIERIKNAVAACIAAINKEPSLPFGAIFITDPDDPSKPYIGGTDKCGIENAYMQTFKYHNEAAGYDCFRYQTPVLTLPYEIGRLVMTVIHTTEDRSVNSATDGPYFNINEFYLYDADGNEIELLPSDFNSNAKESSEGSYEGLLDRNISTFFHSAWSGAHAPEGLYHNLSVAMPEGLKSFSIALEVEWSTTRTRNMPVEVIFSGVTNAGNDLQNAITDANGYGIVPGDDPGFFSGDYTEFFAALDAAKALSSNEEATDEEIYAAIETLEAASVTASEATWNKPKADVVYQLTSRAPYVKNQGKQKNLTVLQDSIMWWADADPADEYQYFTFEEVEGEDEEVYFVIKNVKTGKYIGQFTNEPGLENGYDIEWGNPYYVKLSDTPQPLRATSLGQGQLHFWSYSEADGDWLGFHTCNHNGGSASTAVGNQGGGKGGDHPDGYSIAGVCGPIVQWADAANSGSAWYINQLEELPLSVLVENGFEKKAHHLWSPVQIMSLTSDKACDYNNLTVTDMLGEPIEFSVQKDGYNAVLTFTGYVSDFYFSFDAEGISEVTVTGGVAEKSAMARLQEAYDAANVEYAEGTDVGCVKDASAIKLALSLAEKLLEQGGSDAEIEAAIKAISAAQEALEVVEPEAGKNYYIVSAYDEFEARYSTEMAVYEDEITGQTAWTYINLADDHYMWQFEATETANGTAFYIKNAVTGNYIGNTGSPIAMAATSGGTSPFKIVPFDGLKMNIVDANTMSSDDMLHALNHGSGANVFGALCYYRNEEPTKSVWYIREANSVRTAIDVISVEPETENRVLGVFDMTGRRVDNPEKGLYIINGQKVLVK